MTLHRATFGPAPRPGGPATLVLLHGYGADEHDLVPLAAELGRELPVVSLQGPLSLGGGMRAWYHLQQTRDGFLIDPGEVTAASERVASAVADLVRERGKVVLLGFSQGGGMASREALAHPEGVAALVSLSGVPSRLDPAQRGRADRLRAVRAFVAHGLHDPLLPIETGREVRAELEGAGLAVSYHEYPMGHQIVPAELDDLMHWL